MTEELRILWSPPYLSRLWCVWVLVKGVKSSYHNRGSIVNDSNVDSAPMVSEIKPLTKNPGVFELAAYRTANPSGRIAFQPIFVENLILKSFFGIAAIQGTYLATLQFPTVRGLAGIQALVCFGLILPLIQVVRSFMREKHVAIWQLENFDLTMVDCKNDFDRRFVYGAIRKWYGSEENFESFVRGKLCEELVERFRVIEVPWFYHLLTVCPYLGGWVDITCALWKGGAPFSCVLSFGIGMCLTCGVWALVAVELIYILSDFFAAKRKSCLRNFMVDVGILLCVGLVVLLQTTASRLAYGAAPFTTPPRPEATASPDACLCANSIWTSSALLALVLLLAVLFFKSSLRRMLCGRGRRLRS